MNGSRMKDMEWIMNDKSCDWKVVIDIFEIKTVFLDLGIFSI